MADLPQSTSGSNPVAVQAIQNIVIALNKLVNESSAIVAVASLPLSIANGGTGSSTFISTGTFTPTLSFGGASSGITYATQVGHYTVLGNLVFFGIDLVLTSKGSSTGVALISGLPLAQVADPIAALSVYQSTLGSGATTSIIAAVNGSAQTITVSKYAAGTTTILQDGDFTNTTALKITGHYEH